MISPGKTGRFYGRLMLVLSLLAPALAHVSGQTAPSYRGPSASSPKTIEAIEAPLGFSQKLLPDAMVGVPYRSSVQAIGGSGSYGLTTSGDMPPGMSIETGGATAAFSGVPTAIGTYKFQITIRDENGTSINQDFAIEVHPFQPLSRAPIYVFVTDPETITLTDTPNVYFPVRIIDNEAITLSDSERGLDAAEIDDAEAITVTDTETITVLTVPKIYWSNPAPIAYGTPLSSTQLNATGSVDGKLTYTPPAGTILPPGLQTLSVTLTPSNPAKYATVTATVTVSVGQASQTITFTPPASPVTYPVSPITLSATGGASGNPVTFSVVSGPGTVSGTNGSTLTVTNVGTIVIAANQAGNTDYAPATQVTQIIVVNPPAVAALLSPAPGLGTILGAANISFTWTTAAGAAEYQLSLGTTAPGAIDLYVDKGTATSTIVPTLPANGVTVYATLSTKINGAWQSNAYLYTESGTPVPAVLTSPTPGVGTVLGTTNVPFQWTAGAGVTEYQLNLSAVAPGGSELFLYKGTALTATAPTLPANGIPVYATLYSKINGIWQSNAYVYTESGTSLAILKSPTPGLGTILGTTNVTFQWTTGAGVADYQLNLSAVAPGGSELFLYKGTATSAVAPTLPANGVTVYATLYSKINGVWQSNAYQYTEGGTPTPAVLTSPTPGLSTILGTSNVPFQWNAGIGVTLYQLNLSAVAPGGSELFLYKGTATSAIAPTIPANAVTVYATLYSKINGVWQSNAYQYTEGGTPTPAVLTSPTPGLSTILSTTNVTFQWNAGIGVTDYQLNVSAVAPGNSELFLYKGTALSATATTLPANGVKVYARMYSKINGVWQYNDYVYTEQ